MGANLVFKLGLVNGDQQILGRAIQEGTKTNVSQNRFSKAVCFFVFFLFSSGSYCCALFFFSLCPFASVNEGSEKKKIRGYFFQVSTALLNVCLRLQKQ